MNKNQRKSLSSMAGRLREISKCMMDLRGEVEQFKDDLQATYEEEELKRENMEEHFGETERFWRQSDLVDCLSDAVDTFEEAFDGLVDATFSDLIDVAENIEKAVED